MCTAPLDVRTSQGMSGEALSRVTEMWVNHVSFQGVLGVFWVINWINVWKCSPCPLCYRPQSCASPQSMLELRLIVWEVMSLWIVKEVLHSMSPPLPMESFQKCVSAVIIFKMRDHINDGVAVIELKTSLYLISYRCYWPFNCPLLTGDHYLKRSCSSDKVWARWDIYHYMLADPLFSHVFNSHYSHSCHP